MIKRLALIAAVFGCDAEPAALAVDAAVDASEVVDAALAGDLGADAALDAALNDAASDSGPDAAPTFRVVTFNTGSARELSHDALPDDGYGSAQAEITDEWYGNGLAWTPLVEEARVFLASVDADVLVFQEIFHPGECAAIPEDAREGYVCADWMEGDPTVVQRILGPEYQVACHLGKPDKCAAVHARFGRFRGCEGAVCLESLEGGLEGSPVPGCGSGARVARGLIDRVDGGHLTLVSVHGTSGLSAEDQACREGQVAQVFGDLGDGAPGANGTVNLVLGDFNTDPARFTFDASARAWLAATAEGQPFHFVSPVGMDAPPTYANRFNIDHVVSDALDGTCWSAGSEGRPPVTSTVFFDHLPLVCDVAAR